MHRIFADTDIFREFAVKDKKEIHHALNVLRLKENDLIIAFDGKGNEILGAVKSFDKEKIVIIPQKTLKEKVLPNFSLTLACALPKKAKFDFIVEKTTELGVDRIIPLVTSRTEVRISPEKRAAKLKHWQNIAISASKQSQRTTLPEVLEVTTFKQALVMFGAYDLVLIPCLFGERKSLKQVLKENNFKEILVLIGPEGDFTREEVKLALNKRALPITLGNTVLRVDTAAMFTVSVINALLR